MTTSHSAARTPARLQRLFLAPFQRRFNQGTPWAWLLIALLLVLGPVLLVVFDGADPNTSHAAAVIAACEAMLAMGCGWALLAASFMDQNRPVAARLVPFHARDLRLAALISATATTTVVAGLMASVFEQTVHDPLLLLTLTAGMVAAVGAAVRWRAATWAISFSPLIVIWLSHEAWWAQVELALQAAWHGAPVAIASVALLACAVVPLLLIQSGGDLHARNYAARKEAFARLRMRGLGSEPTFSGAGWHETFRKWRFRPFDALSRRWTSRPGAPVMGRLLLALGPSTHWTTQLVNLMLLLLALVSMVGLLYASLARAEANAILGTLMQGFAVGSVFGMGMPALQLAARLHHIRGEQALLVLLPGVPRGAALARRLSLRLTVQCLMTWAAGVLILVSGQAAARALQPSSHEDFFHSLAPFLAAGLLLPIAPALWPTWARMKAPTPSTKLWILAMPAVAVLVGFTLMAAEIASGAQVTAGLVAVSVAWCVVRWIRMGSEPSPFPVGRLLDAPWAHVRPRR